MLDSLGKQCARLIVYLACYTLFADSRAPTCRGGELAFRRHVINADSEFMAAAVFDVNKDGKLDIVCGGWWYEAPTWKKHFLRKVEIQGGRPDGYAHQVLDVNGDGWPDLVTVNWRTASLKWIEHPGANLAKGLESCGFTTFPRCKGANLADGADPRRMPRIRDVHGNDPAKIPFDFAELLATMAPRAVFVSVPLKDDVMEVAGVKSAIAGASAVYEFRKAGGSLQITYPEGGRDFSAAAREEAFAWLEKRLKK